MATLLNSPKDSSAERDQPVEVSRWIEVHVHHV